MVSFSDSRACGQIANDAGGFRDSFVQAFAELGGLNVPTSREFAIALPRVGFPANARADPLAHVAAQMQNQVSHRVFVVVISRPDLLARKPAQAILNAAAQLSELVGGECQKILFDHKISIDQFSRIDLTLPVN